MSKTTKRWILTAAVWIGTVVILGFIKFSQISAAIAFGESFPEPSETVITAQPVRENYRPQTRVVAEVVPVRSVTMSNELAGAIVEVGFAPGDRVSEGQVMIRQDTSEELALLAAANAREALAERTLDRNENLLGGSAVSRQAVDDALAQRDAARAEAQRVQAIIEKKTIRAPFAARSGLERWEPGGYLDAGSVITTLVGEGDEVWVDFSLPQQHAGVAVGDSVTVHSDHAGRAPATVIARAPQVDASSRAVRYRAALASPELAAVPGAIAAVFVNTDDPRPALKVPAVAVREDTFGPHVFVLIPAESGADARFRASRRSVEVLRIEAEFAFLSAGVEPGDTIAAQGSFKLRDGLLVNQSAVRSGPGS